MSTVELDGASGANAEFFFNDEAGYLATIRKSAELGTYYFGWLSDWTREMLSTPFMWLGQLLRDRLYFPLTHPDEGFRSNMQMGAELHRMLTGKEKLPDTDAFPQLEEVRQAFDVKTVPVKVVSCDRTYIFQLYIVESKEKVDGKGLRLFLMSFYGNEVMDGQGKRDWKPETIYELGAAPILILKALREQGYEIDSLDLFSLGAVAFEGLNYLNPADAALIPPVIILDRAMSSTYKVGQKLYSFPLSYLLYGSAYASNWDADPERACLNFFEQVSSLEGRTMVQVEAVKDSYFSGVGAYDSDFLQRLKDLGMETFGGKFYVPCYKEASHHALGRSLIYNNPSSGTSIDDFIEMKPLESLAGALARKVYSEGSGDYHQSLVLGGNSEDLNIVLMRMYPMLCAYLRQES